MDEGIDYEKQLETAKVDLVKAQMTVVDVYLGKIRDCYETLDEVRKSQVIKSLDILVQNIATGTPIISETHQPFLDPKIMREIRLKENLTQHDLVVKLMGEEKALRSNAVRISSFENGYVRPGYPPRSDFTKKYIQWLKEHGYNPYNI